MLDDLLAQVDGGGLQLTGEGGFLPELVKAVLERGLDAELTGHLGYEQHDPAGKGSGNSRNGATDKRLGTEIGDFELATPRDRNGTFDPKLVPKGQRRVKIICKAASTESRRNCTPLFLKDEPQSTGVTRLSSTAARMAVTRRSASICRGWPAAQSATRRSACRR